MTQGFLQALLLSGCSVMNEGADTGMCVWQGACAISSGAAPTLQSEAWH